MNHTVTGVSPSLTYRWKLLLVLFLASFGTANAEEKPSDALQFDIPVVSGVERHLDLLPYPPYLAIALDNNGITPSNSGRAIIVDHHTLRLKNTGLRFLEKKGTKYFYQATIEWDIAAKQVQFKIPVEVDSSTLNTGKLSVRFYLPLARFFPQAITDRIRLKIQSLAGDHVQKKMLSYLDDLKKKQPPGSNTPEMLQGILIQGYNQAPSSTATNAVCEPGDAEPLSDQAILLATLFIWLVVVPLGFLLRRMYRRKRIGG